MHENIFDGQHNIVLCSLNTQFNKHAVVFLPGGERCGVPFTRFPLFFNASLREIIPTKIRSVPLFFFNDYTSGVNLVWNLRGRKSGSTKCRFFKANFRTISIFSGKNFWIPFFFSDLPQNFRLSRQLCHLQKSSVQIILFRLKSHHFREWVP